MKENLIIRASLCPMSQSWSLKLDLCHHPYIHFLITCWYPKHTQNWTPAKFTHRRPLSGSEVLNSTWLSEVLTVSSDTSSPPAHLYVWTSENSHTRRNFPSSLWSPTWIFHYLAFRSVIQWRVRSHFLWAKNKFSFGWNHENCILVMSLQALSADERSHFPMHWVPVDLHHLCVHTPPPTREEAGLDSVCNSLLMSEGDIGDRLSLGKRCKRRWAGSGSSVYISPDCFSAAGEVRP